MSTLDKVMKAIRKNKPKKLNHLLEQGDMLYLNKLVSCTDTSDCHLSLLMIAAKLGHHAIVKCLIDHGAVVNFATETGITAISYAAAYNHPLTLNTLVQHGANVNLRCYQYGNTPLHNAVGYNHPRIIEVLIQEHNADVYRPDNRGWTPLHLAAILGNLQALKTILQYQPISKGTTILDRTMALHFAIHYERLDCVSALLEAGADAAVKTGDGTALEVAKAHKFTDIIHCLEQHLSSTTSTSSSTSTSTSTSTSRTIDQLSDETEPQRNDRQKRARVDGAQKVTVVATFTGPFQLQVTSSNGSASSTDTGRTVVYNHR